jgi:hypothetical protein
MAVLLELHLQVETVLLSDLLPMAAVEVVNGKHRRVAVALAEALVHLAKILQVLRDPEPQAKEAMAVLEPYTLTLLILVVLAEVEAAQAVLA